MFLKSNEMRNKSKFFVKGPRIDGTFRYAWAVLCMGRAMWRLLALASACWRLPCAGACRRLPAPTAADACQRSHVRKSIIGQS